MTALGLSSRPRAASVALAMGITAAACVLWLALNPLGGDQAAHAYLTDSLSRSGAALWDNFWYAGRYQFVNYSVLYYPAAAVLGERTVVTLSILASSAGMTLLLWRLAGPRARVAAVLFGASVSLQLVLGQYPFALGTAFAIWAGVALISGRPVLAVAAGAASALASPLAFLFLDLVTLGMMVGSGRVRASRGVRYAAVGLAAVTGLIVLLMRAFSDGGRYPFSAVDLLRLLVFSGALWWALRRDPTAAALRGVTLVYAASAIALFAVPFGVGSNLERLGNYVALPLVAIVLTRRRSVPAASSLILIAASLSLQVMPAASAIGDSVNNPTTDPTFWVGTQHYLTHHLSVNYRVEVVPTSAHWESYYLPDVGIPLARGWFRQDDYPLNASLYADALSPGRYAAWLRRLAIAYVVLPNATIDPFARSEATLVQHQASAIGLKRVFGDPHTTIFAVTNPTPLITSVSSHATASIETMTRSAITVQVSRAGSYLLRVRFTPYWTITPEACLAPSYANDVTRILVAHAGVYQLQFAPSAERIFDQVIGATQITCVLPRAS
jgi:hypothetical protein